MTGKSSLRAGTLTLLLTDIEGSSRLWEHQPDAMKEAIARHDRIIDKAISAHGGIRPLEQGEGDSTFSAFDKPSDALSCALKIQKAFLAESWPTPVILRVRAALHTGEVELRDESRYWGPAINRCARLRGIAHGGQTLVSRVTYELTADRLPANVSLKDMGTHQLKDLSTPEQVYQLCHPVLPSDFPPLLSLDAFPNNLPLQLKSFIPREREMEEVKRRLTSHRLVTLTGAGGSGKTRLALQVAAESIEQYPGGVWMVDLAPVSDPEAVLETLARSVRVPAAALMPPEGRSLLEAIIDYLRIRKTLLILDNCEHMLDTTSEIVVPLLQSCPDLTFLVTSREALGLDGENAWRITSLPIPDPEDSVVEIADFQAVQLFVERASASRPDFAITPDNAAAVAEITRRLDGLPLAIELAAARVNVLAPHQIASMLSDTFRLLAGGSRSALERQQTIRASIDWSYKLLSDSEQTLLRRLSVFAGGATLEGVEEVCSGDGLDRSEILDLLSHLVQKSLLEVAESGELVRYRFLEMIRQYAREKLNDSGESDKVRTRHRDHYMNFVEEADRALTTPGVDTPWLEAIAGDHDNVRTALEWSIDRGEMEEALRIVSSLFLYWWLRKAGEEAWSWMEKTLAMEGDVSAEIMWRAYLAKAYASALSGKGDSAKAAKEALQAFDRSALAPSFHSVNAHWIAALGTGGREGWELWDRALRDAQQLEASGDRLAEGTVIATRGLVAFRKGDLAEARGHFDRALALWLGMGNVQLVHDALGVWPYITAMQQRDYEGARGYTDQALAFWRERGDELRVAYSLNDLGYVSKSQGRFDQARSEIGEGLAILKRVGDARSIANFTHSLGEVEEAAGNLESARSLYLESLSLSRENENVSTTLECLWGLARVARAQGNLGESIGYLVQTLEMRKDRPDVGAWVRRLTQVLAEREPERAARLFGALQARAVASELVYPPQLEAEDYESAVEKARAALGEEAFRALWQEGSEMDFDAAVHLALEVGRP